MIEHAIERAFELGFGLSLLHGTLCSLPIYIRNEFHDCLNQTESLLCPLLLLQEQLRSTLPPISKIKLGRVFFYQICQGFRTPEIFKRLVTPLLRHQLLQNFWSAQNFRTTHKSRQIKNRIKVQQNTHLIRNVHLENAEESEWKLVIYLHQIIRLTMALWKDDTLDKDSFGVLQVFLHNELKPILIYLFDQKPNSILLSMVGMSSKTPTPSFQLLVKVPTVFSAAMPIIVFTVSSVTT